MSFISEPVLDDVDRELKRHGADYEVESEDYSGVLLMWLSHISSLWWRKKRHIFWSMGERSMSSGVGY